MAGPLARPARAGRPGLPRPPYSPPMRLAPLVLLAALLAGAPPPTLGLGFATVAVDDGLRLDLFDAPGGAAPPAASVGVVLSSPAALVVRPGGAARVEPAEWWPDFGLLAFRVVAVADGAVEVVVDEASGRTLWLRDGPAVTYKPWARYLVEDVTGFDRLDPARNPVRAEPHPGAPVVAGGAEPWGCVAAAEVRGEWVRTRRSDLCPPDAAGAPDGWVRWRDGDRLLIAYGLTC